MIDVKELRIGNVIKSIHTPMPVVVDLFLFGEIRDDETYLDHLIPIHLTSDILLKCGFEKVEDAGNWNEPEWDIYKNNGFAIGYKETKCCYYHQSDDDFYSGYWPEIKLLHQLQNLYFALNGKELIYTP